MYTMYKKKGSIISPRLSIIINYIDDHDIRSDTNNHTIEETICDVIPISNIDKVDGIVLRKVKPSNYIYT